MSRSLTAPADPQRATDRRLAQQCVLDALLAMSEAATLELIQEHPELQLRAPTQDAVPPHDIGEEARRLVDLLEELRDAVRRYGLVAYPDDDVPF